MPNGDGQAEQPGGRALSSGLGLLNGGALGEQGEDTRARGKKEGHYPGVDLGTWSG
jgi:hypothetical protein